MDNGFPMLYHIQYLMPQEVMGGAGFAIQLFPALREVIAKYGMTQKHADGWLDHHREQILRGHRYDPDLYKHGPPRVAWGEWGPEHISVPGDACGLDIDHRLGSPPGGAILRPHNVDGIRQAHMLLCIFTGLMSHLTLNLICEASGVEVKPFD